MGLLMDMVMVMALSLITKKGEIDRAISPGGVQCDLIDDRLALFDH